MASAIEGLDTYPLLTSPKSKSKYSICNVYKYPLGCAIRVLKSGKLLKGWALALGLWCPRGQYRAMFALIFLLADVYLVLDCLARGIMCPLNIDSPLNAWFCVNQTSPRNNLTARNDASLRSVWHTMIKGNGMLFFVLKIALLGSHSSFLWSIWALPKMEATTIGQQRAHLLIKDSDWLRMNCQMTLFGCALILFIILVFTDIQGARIAAILFNILYPIPLWTSLMACWLFACVMLALECLVGQWQDEIQSMTHCSIDDLIRAHKKLYKQVINTTNAFKSWFVIHWVVYALSTVFWCADMADFIRRAFLTWHTAFLEITCVIIYLYVFIYPCHCAARVTRKCQQILADFNMTTSDDWPPTHPFYHRSQLSLFLQYAVHADCGYRVGSITFRSMYVSFSALLAIISVGMKLI